MFRNIHRHHQFFCQKEMNEIYLSVFLMNLAESMISIFVPIYLYYLHYSVAQILFFFFLSSLGSVILALPAAKMVAKFGAKHSILFSTPFLIIYYLGLYLLEATPWLFYLLPLFLTLRCLFYNFGFDLNFVDHLDRRRVGKALSALATFSIIGAILSPLVAGLIIAFSGFVAVFLIGSLLLIISVIPLLVTKDIHPRINFTTNNIINRFWQKKNASMILSFTGYAIESSIGRNVWPVFLIIIFGAAQQVGYVAAISAFATVVVIRLTGKLADKFSPQKLLRLGTLFYFFGWLGTLFADASVKVFFIDSYKNVSERFLILPWASLFYKMFQRKKFFELLVFRDMIFNASRLIVMPLIMLIFVIDFYPFTLSFIIASLFTLLYPLINRAPIEETEM